MSTNRGATMIEGLGEPEQDANSALTDLDKGLRSNNVGQQCEAIVRFPRLFEKYPFPILINSSFLKLADVFRVGNNFLRLWVLRVCQESEKHLDKILNVDEFVRRVFSVIHANDPVARALSLRTLGSVACVIPERQQVHHCIRNSLDSHDTIEVEAAIYAAMQFAAQSKSFALGMCNKISDMIQGLSTPAHMKLQLIPILQYMHHDTSTAAMVRKVCTELLPKYPAKDFVITTLNTLTKLAASTLVDIPNQVELLLQYLVDDSRWGVKVVAVGGLYQLAKVSPHLWPPHCLSTVIRVARTSQNLVLTGMALDLFIVLTKSPVVCHEYIDRDSELTLLCFETCYSSNPVISAKSVRIITQIVCFLFEENLLMAVVDVEEYIGTVESLLLLMISSQNRSETENKVLASCLQCAVSLCKVHRPLSNRFIQLIAPHLSQGICSLLLCEALAGIAGLEPQALEGYLSEILGAIESLAASSLESDAKTKVMLCTLLLQTKQPIDLDESGMKAINLIIGNIDPWCKYKIARAAARYGHFKVCRLIIPELTEEVSSEHLHFWLQGLVEISAGESALASEEVPLLDRLGIAISHYNTAISSLKAGSSPSNSLAFQCEYAGLRCELLQCFSQLVASCHSLCFSPPPAIAVTLMHTTRDELQRYGHITNQLRKCAKTFRNCADLYWKLYQSAFDADSASLKNIQIMQHSCLMMAYSIECLSLPNQQSDEPSLEYGLKGGSLETQIMIESCQAASALASSITKNSKTITHEHIDCLIKQVEILTTNPLCLPRYFFQVLQATSVKLAVSPQPKVLGESISLTSGSQLAVKVEGVIQHGTRAGLFRSVDKIVVSLTTQLFPRTNNNTNEKVVEGTGCTMTQTVKPHKDFFTAQFLVSLGAGSAQATVTVAASVIDQDGSVWQTGPKSTLTVKQHDDPTNRPL